MYTCTCNTTLTSDPRLSYDAPMARSGHFCSALRDLVRGVWLDGHVTTLYSPKPSLELTTILRRITTNTTTTVTQVVIGMYMYTVVLYTSDCSCIYVHVRTYTCCVYIHVQCSQWVHFAGRITSHNVCKIQTRTADNIGSTSEVWAFLTPQGMWWHQYFMHKMHTHLHMLSIGQILLE